MKTAKEWHYSQCVVGMDDERNGTYEWFKKMEDYAKYYHETKVKNLSSNGMLADSYLPSELISLAEYYSKKYIATHSNNGGCSSVSQEEKDDIKKICNNIEKKLQEMANNFR